MYKDTEMLDRQDIDALLMGALYGELSPTESTRLEEHLSAHPQDRMVLDGLSRARQAVKDSLVLALQAEPPAKVSAMLMQEAARRAPAPRAQRAGFFAKLVALMRHPAFAAVAVIVLIAAVGGTVFRKSGDRNVAEQQVASQPPSAPMRDEVARPAVEPPASADPSKVAVDENEAINGGDGYTADLEDGGVQDKQLSTPTSRPTTTGKAGVEPGALGKGSRPEKTKPGKPEGGAFDYVEVRTPEPEPKTPDDGDGKADQEVASTKPGDASGEKTRGKTTATVIIPGDTPSTGTTGLAMGGDLATKPTSGGGTAASAGTAPQVAGRQYADAPPEANTASTSDKDGAETVNTESQNTKKAEATAAAKAQHTQLIRLVKANKCADASKIALQLSDRYPDYYAQFVANDRRVKPCKPYIDNVRKKNAAKAKRERTDQAQEAPAPDSMKLTSPD
jgi:hypothetical protein